MKLYGLTGGIGMGKSTASDILERWGVPVVDTDVIARQIVEPGQPALAEIRAVFGEDIVAADGRLKRRELAQRVFADSDARRQLEGILHPRIRATWTARAARWRAEGRLVAVVVIPLLFETGAGSEVDATICVACSTASQHQRLVARGWNDDQIRGRLSAQWPLEKKIAAADRVIWTEGKIEVHALQLMRAMPEVAELAATTA